MRDSAAALRFLANLFRPGIDRVSPSPTFFHVGRERLDVDGYRPRRPPLGTVLMVHGMNTRGHRDPRLVTAAQAFAGAGYRVFAPRFPAVAGAKITYASVERIVGAIENAARREEGPVGVFAPSFSAAMSMLAGTHDAARGLVSALFAMGTYCDPRTVIRYLIEDESAHPYGRMIVLRNFLHRSVGPVAAIEHALDRAIVDAALHRPENPEVFDALPASDHALITTLLNDVTARMEHLERMLASDHDRLLDRMSLPKVVDQVRFPVTLLHGEGDDVIPPEESIELARRLEAQGIDVHLNVSPLISHGDTLSFWKQRQAVVDAVRTFGHFLGHVSRGARTWRAAA